MYSNYNGLGFQNQGQGQSNDANYRLNQLQHFQQQMGDGNSDIGPQTYQQMNNYQLQVQLQALQHNQQGINQVKSPTMNGFGFYNNGNNGRRRFNNNGGHNVLTKGSLFNNLQPPQPPANQQVIYNRQPDSVPQTPFDLNYGASMLPRNLLLSSPFIGSPMAPGTPGGNFQQASKYMSVTGPAPPIMQAPPKFKKKQNQTVISKVEEEEDDLSEDELIITEGEQGSETVSETSKPRTKKETFKPFNTFTRPEHRGAPVTLKKKKLSLSNKVIVLCHINPNVRIYEFLNSLKFGPVQFCHIENSEEDENENQIKLKFIYERTHNNFLNHFHLYINEFFQEFKSFNATYKIVDYDIKDYKTDEIDIQHEIEVNKATRSLKITNFTKFELLNDDHENIDKKLRLKYGEIDLINTNEDKNIMTIHFLNLISSVKLHKDLNESDSEDKPLVCYQEDRCCTIDDDEFEQTFGQTSDFDEHLENESEKVPPMLMKKDPYNQSSKLLPPIILNLNSLNTNDNRTVYLGNLASKTTVEEICNVVRGGILQSIKLISEKHICFITFISAISATQFFASSNLNGLSIHNKKVKIGWGKNPGDLPNSIALAVTVGASRNVYIGVKEGDEETNVVPDEPTLRRDFARYGEIEHINFFKDGYCAFVNFINITSAMKSVDDFNGVEKDEVHRSFDNKYVRYKINFAKDRCGNPPKFINKQKKKKKPAAKKPDNDTIKAPEVSDQQALALASIGITSLYIDEKLKTQDEPEESRSISSSPSVSDKTKTQYGLPYPRTRKPTNKRHSVGSSQLKGAVGGFGSSGSQVMAQYLARAQYDGLMYDSQMFSSEQK